MKNVKEKAEAFCKSVVAVLDDLGYYGATVTYVKTPKGMRYSLTIHNQVPSSLKNIAENIAEPNNACIREAERLADIAYEAWRAAKATK